MSGCQIHLSETLCCKNILLSKHLHSSNISSSHTHNLLLHLHASPPSSQPWANIEATVIDFSTTRSNRRLNLLLNGTSPNHLSCQNNVFVPSPILLDTLPENHLPSSSPPPPSLIFATSLHKKEILHHHHRRL